MCFGTRLGKVPQGKRSGRQSWKVDAARNVSFNIVFDFVYPRSCVHSCAVAEGSGVRRSTKSTS